MSPRRLHTITIACWSLVALMLGVLAVSKFPMTSQVVGTKAPSGTDFHQFYYAARAVLDGDDPYQSYQQGYIYPPAIALAMTPLALLDVLSATRVWYVLNSALVVACLWLAFGVVAERLRVPRTPDLRAACVCIVLALGLELVRRELAMGQTDTLVLLCFVLALRWLDARPLRAGAVLGACLLIKYLSLIVLPYLLLRGRWKAAGSMAVTATVLALAPALVFGWRTNLAYLDYALGGLTRAVGVEREAAAHVHWVGWDNSISITSAMARLTHEPGGGHSGYPLALAIAVGTALLAWGLYAIRRTPMFRGRFGRRERGRPGVVLIEWCGLIAAVLAFGPQTTKRHVFLALLLPMVSVVLGLCARGVRTKVLAWTSMALFAGGLVLPPGDWEAAADWWNRVGGASWCLLACWFGLVWCVLSTAPDGIPPIESDDALDARVSA